MVTVNKEEARQGETRNEVRWILLISTALAVLVLGAFFLVNVSTRDDSEAPATETESAVPDASGAVETAIYLV